MKHKWMAVIMAAALFFQGIFGMGLVKVSANPEELSGEEAAYSVTDVTYGLAQNADSIITKVVVKDEATGTVIDAVYNPDRLDRSKLGDQVRIEYNWALENGHGYNSGSKFEFTIPPEFQIFNPVSGDLIIDDGSIIGTFTVEMNGNVTFVFNVNVDNSEVSGTFEVHTVFSEENITGSVEVSIYFPIRGGVQKAVVNFTPKDGKLLDKDGTAYKDKSIDWTIDVNTSLDKIENAVVSDRIPEGLELDASSIKVYKLLPNVDREPSLGDLIDPSSGEYVQSVEPDGSGFRIAFSEPAITSAYRIQYTTLVAAEEETRFTNQAELTGSGISAQADKTVTIVRTPLLTKEVVGYDLSTQTIAWRVKYNYGEKAISQSDALIHDRFTNSMELVPGSLKVIDAIGNELDNQNGDLYEATPVNDPSPSGKNGFDLQFKFAVVAAYDIVYETRAVDRVYRDTTVTNDVYAEVSGKESSYTDSFTFRSGIGVKSLDGVNYSTKELTWKIVVNRDMQPMTNLVIEDHFTGGGLSYIEDSLQVVSSGAPVPSFTIDDNDPDNGFTVTFTGTFVDMYTITYKTKFIPEKSQYLNKATLGWTEKTSDYPDISAGFNPNAETKNNGRKTGSYDLKDKKLVWKTVANYNSNAVEGAVFTDELQEGQTLLPETVKVYKTSVNADGSVEAVESSEAVTLDQDKISYTGNTLRIELGDIDAPYWITFETELDKVLVADKIPNTAVLTGADGKSWSWQGSVTIPRGGEYVGKSGKQNGGQIDWSIVINGSQSYIENATIIDTPSSNQILLQDTFELYQATVNPDKSVSTVGGKLTEGEDYFLQFNDDPENDRKTFELTFAATEIDSAYLLRYSSEIAVSADREEVANEVSFTGDGVKLVTQETSGKVTVRFTDGSGTGTGLRGSLEVTKVDKEDHGTKLAGAAFKLLNGKGELVGEKTTDADGKVTFTKLLYDTYSLVETAAPGGYILDGTPLAVKIDQEVQSTGGVKAIIVENAKPTEPPTEPEPPIEPEPEPSKGKLIVVKVDKDDRTKVLAGATFVLQDAAKARPALTVTTDAEGKAVFADLPYDDYVLEETAAPEGYLIEGAAQRLIAIDSGIEPAGELVITVDNRKKPETPGNPGNPENPGNPSKPDKPSKPSNPSNPSDPSNPDDSDTPVTPPAEEPQPGDDNVELPEDPTPADGTNGEKPQPDQEQPTDLELDDEGNPLGGTHGDPPSDDTGEQIPGVSVLPKTGEGDLLPYQLSGAGLILLGVLLRKRRTQQK